MRPRVPAEVDKRKQRRPRLGGTQHHTTSHDSHFAERLNGARARPRRYAMTRPNDKPREIARPPNGSLMRQSVPSGFCPRSAAEGSLGLLGVTNLVIEELLDCEELRSVGRCFGLGGIELGAGVASEAAGEGVPHW
jgi:hypothetical protein